jgi:hypothetical protein
MTLDPTSVGIELPPRAVNWTSDDCLRCAISVGTGTTELHFTTENSDGIQQRMVPTMPVMLGVDRDIFKVIGQFEWSALVHAEQSVAVHRPLPVNGSGVATSRVMGIEDKGKAAIGRFDTAVVDNSGEAVVTCSSAVYIRGQKVGEANGFRPGALVHPRLSLTL